MVLFLKLLYLDAYLMIPVTRSLIINIFTNNFEKSIKNCILTRTISDHQMTCMLPNHNVINPVNRNYIEVENIMKKNHLDNLRAH